MYTHANRTKNQGWIYPPWPDGVQGGAIFYDKAKKTK